MRVYELICFEGSVIKKEGTLQPVMSGYGNAPQSIAEQFVTLLLINKTNNVPSAYKIADKKHREEMDKLKCWERKRSQAWTCLPKGRISFAGELRLKGAGRCTANKNQHREGSCTSWQLLCSAFRIPGKEDIQGNDEKHVSFW